MAFRKVFSGIWGGAAALGSMALAAVLIIPTCNGIKTALDDNPEGKDDISYDTKQFAEGATFGAYNAEKGRMITAEEAGAATTDTVVDTAIETADVVKRFSQGALERGKERMQPLVEDFKANGNSSQTPNHEHQGIEIPCEYTPQIDCD